MSDPKPGRRDELRELQAAFGAVMVQIQLIELTLLGLVNAQEEKPESRGGAEGVRRLEELFSLTAGQLRQCADIADGDLAELVESAIQLRNQLVHGWLVRSTLAVANGSSSLAAQRDELATAEAAFRRVQIDLQSLLEGTIAEADKELLSTLMEWRARFGSVPTR